LWQQPRSRYNIVIPTVEGTDGFIITDIIASNILYSFFQDIGDGPVPLYQQQGGRITFAGGIPLIVGSTLTVQVAGGNRLLVIGYVY